MVGAFFQLGSAGKFVMGGSLLADVGPIVHVESGGEV